MTNKKDKLIFVITGPSQSGKTTGKEFLANALDLEVIPTYTTRAPYATEKDGVDYHYITEAEFQEMREKGEFLESSEHYGAKYGTGRVSFYEAIEANRPVVVAINVDGADAFKEEFGDNCVTIFIAPPNPEVWMKRVEENRGASEERVSSFTEEMAKKDKYDYVIVNEHLSQYYMDLGKLVSSLLK